MPAAYDTIGIYLGVFFFMWNLGRGWEKKEEGGRVFKLQKGPLFM